MDHKAFFLEHWNREGATTRKVLGRVPSDRCGYQPHPESRTARELAWLIVYEEGVLVDGLEKNALDWVDRAAPATMEEILAAYDAQHDNLTARLRAIEAPRWESTIPFLFGGQEAMRDKMYAMAWGFLHDQIHHRGQLSTYLRPMGAKVPAIYGPSGDESM